MKQNFDYKEISSYEAACKRNGEEPITDWGDKPKDEIAYIKLKSITKALNNGWVANYRDGSQKKWFPWFYVSPSGFAFVVAHYDYSLPHAGGAARLCLKDSELARYSGETFLKLWEDFIV